MVCTLIKLSKHDQHVQELCDKLSGYDTVLSHVVIRSTKKRPVAEADVIAYRGAVCDVFEVKCSHRIVKARKQLQKIKKHLDKREMPVGNLFFYCGDSGTLFAI